MNITTHRTGGDKSMRWCAYDDDIYDGAPDSGWPSNCLGHGPTELQAVYDYLCQRGLDEELDAKEQALIWTKIAAKENSEDMIETAAKMADYFDDVLGGLIGPMG